MRFKTIVDKDKSGLEMVLDAMNELIEGRFIEGIRYKHHSLYEIAQTKEEIGIYQHRLNLESIALVRFSESFISQYATDNNECFNEAEVFVNKITSTLCCIREQFKKMTLAQQSQLYKENPELYKELSKHYFLTKNADN